MSPKLLEAVQNDDAEQIQRLIGEGVDVDERDEFGWTPLCWAAGRGNTEVVQVLLSAGADLTASGRDNRPPLMIAKAAGRHPTAALLSQAEQHAGVWNDPRETVQYCKAYLVKDLRAYAGFSESEVGVAALADDDIVYLHQDYTLTRSMWHSEDVLVTDAGLKWRQFCDEELAFRIPEDLL